MIATVFYRVTLSIRSLENLFFCPIIQYIAMFCNITEGCIEVQVQIVHQQERFGITPKDKQGPASFFFFYFSQL